MKKRVCLLSAVTILAAQEAGEIELTADDEIVMEEQAAQAPDSLPPLEKMPVQTGFADAVYPDSLQKAGVEGTVLLNLLVNETGVVESTTVVRGFHSVLDSSALEASKKFTFTPAQAQGKPAAVFIEYEYNFTLDEVVKQLDEFVNFTGTVTERGTRVPVADASVAVSFTGKSYDGISVPLDRYLEKIGEFEGQSLENGVLITTTDSLGRFSFKSLPAGEISVKIPQTGYEILETRDSVKTGEQLELKLWMNRLSYNDYTVTSYYTGEEKEVSRRQISVNEIKKVAGLGGDAVKVVQAMPGVARPSFSSGEVVIRGSYTWDSKFNLDGINMPLLYHFGGLKSCYNAEGLAGLDFYPGGFGSTYGNAIGGVVDLKTKKPVTDRIHGKLDGSLLDVSFFTEGPIIKDKLSFTASARRSHFGEVLQAAQKQVEKKSDVNFGATAVPFYWDYIGRLDYTPNKKHRISFSTFGSYDSLAVLFEDLSLGADEMGTDTDKIRQKTFFNLAGVTHEWDIADQLKNKLSAFYTHASNNIAIFGFFRQQLKTNGIQYRDNLMWKPADKLTVNGGIDGYAGQVDLTLDILTEYGISRDSSNGWDYSQIGAYANLEWKPTEKLLVIPGIRYDYYGHLKYDGSIVPEFSDYGSWNHRGISGDPSLRLTSRYQLNDKHLIKAAVGTYNQEPQPQGQVTHPKWGTPTLPSSKAAHYVGGYEWKITDLLSLDVQGYYNRQWNLPRRPVEADLVSLESKAPLYMDDGKGRTFGMEVMLRRYQSEHFFGWLAYTLSRSERWDYDAKEWQIFEKDQTNNLQLVGSWKLRKNWEMGGRFRYTTGNPTTPVIGQEEDFGTHSFSAVYGKENSARLDPFVQFDYRVEKKFILKHSILTPYIDIQNASYFFYKSAELKTWDDFYKDQSVIAMPLIPAVGLSWEF